MVIKIINTLACGLFGFLKKTSNRKLCKAHQVMAKKNKLMIRYNKACVPSCIAGLPNMREPPINHNYRLYFIYNWLYYIIISGEILFFDKIR